MTKDEKEALRNIIIPATIAKIDNESPSKNTILD